MDKTVTPEEQHLKNALKAWAEAKGDRYVAKPESDPSYYIIDESKEHKPHIRPTLNLDWWREVPILDEYEYFRNLLLILGVDGKMAYVRAVSKYRLIIHNATILQRMEALFNMEVES